LPNLSIQRPVKCRFLTYAENERLEATGERPDDVTTHWIINWRTLMQDAPPISKLVGRVVELPAVPADPMQNANAVLEEIASAPAAPEPDPLSNDAMWIAWRRHHPKTQIV
jgi:hypothetical protein